IRYRMTYVCPFMWLRLKPLLQVGAIHSLTTCAHSRQSEKETRQEMASWRKAADEGHETGTSFFSTMDLIAAACSLRDQPAGDWCWCPVQSMIKLWGPLLSRSRTCCFRTL
ncbi:hypothetical protein BKA67DRAFT_586311, partial [Truncatella angustata]